MKVYIAAPWVEKAKAIEIGKQFEAAGHEVTSRWFHHRGVATDPTGKTSPDWRIKKQAKEDLKDVERADVVVVLNLQRSEGKAVETGYALAHNKQVISVGPRGNIFQVLGTEVDSVEEALEYLQS